MPRMKRKATTTKSEHWLRLAVGVHTGVLNTKVIEAFNFPKEERIEWLSPIHRDDYCEYRDQEFLHRLGVVTEHLALEKFWPPRGPQWDGLARTRSGKLILVEAKAYPGEAKTQCMATGEASLRLIETSLSASKRYFGADPDADWTKPYYQYANRLAHLYFMRVLNQLDAHLLFLNFADAPDVSTPCDVPGWIRDVEQVRDALGLPSNFAVKGVATSVWSVAAMQEGRA